MTETTALTPEEQAEFDALAAAEAAEAEKAKEGAKTKPAKTKKVEADEAPRERVLEKKAFINGRLYEVGETVSEDASGNFIAVPKSKPAGELTLDDLKQLLAQAEARKGAAA